MKNSRPRSVFLRKKGGQDLVYSTVRINSEYSARGGGHASDKVFLGGKHCHEAIVMHTLPPRWQMIQAGFSKILKAHKNLQSYNIRVQVSGSVAFGSTMMNYPPLHTAREGGGEGGPGIGGVDAVQLADRLLQLVPVDKVGPGAVVGGRRGGGGGRVGGGGGLGRREALLGRVLGLLLGGVLGLLAVVESAHPLQAITNE